jgi:hypothetical protein
MGIVVEYAWSTGDPQWTGPPPCSWDYRVFTKPDATAAVPDQVIELPIENQLPSHKPTDTIHPIHLYRNTFEVTRIAGTLTRPGRRPQSFVAQGILFQQV